MRHRKAGFKLNRTTAHRTAMLRNLAASLFEHGQVVTTLQKAKAVQPFVEKIVTKAKRGDMHARRQVIATLGRDRNAFAWRYLPANATEEERQRHQEVSEQAEQFFDVFHIRKLWLSCLLTIFFLSGITGSPEKNNILVQ